MRSRERVQGGVSVHVRVGVGAERTGTCSRAAGFFTVTRTASSVAVAMRSGSSTDSGIAMPAGAEVGTGSLGAPVAPLLRGVSAGVGAGEVGGEVVGEAVGSSSAP